MLESRFGDPFVLANAFRDKLDAWPKVQSRDIKALRKLVDFIKQCDAAMESVSSLSVLNDERENKKILCKLPDWIIPRWGRLVSNYREERRVFPHFHEFVNFMVKESNIANDPITSLVAVKGNHDNPKTKVRGVRAFNTEIKEETVEVCLL